MILNPEAAEAEAKVLFLQRLGRPLRATGVAKRLAAVGRVTQSDNKVTIVTFNTSFKLIVPNLNSSLYQTCASSAKYMK